MTVKEDRRARIQKMMGGGESEASPKISAEKFIPSGQGEYISSSHAKSLQTVNIKLGSISNALKDSLVLSKVRMGIERQNKEKLRRKKREKELESSKKKDKPKGKKPQGLKVPFMDRISNFLISFLFGSVLMGLVNMGDNPKLQGFMDGLATAGKNILISAEWLLKSMVNLIDWGYKVYDSVKSFVADNFGEKGVAIFEALGGALNKVVNALGVIGLVFLKFRKFFTNLIKNTFKIFRRGLGKAFKRLSLKIFGKGGVKLAQNIGKVAGKVGNFAKNIGGKAFNLTKNVGGKALNLAKGVGGKLAGVGKNLLGAGKGLATKGASKIGGFAVKLFGKAAKLIAPAMKSAKPFLSKFFGKIPILGPLVIGIVSILSGDPVGKALFKTIGAALGGALGTFIPIPVIGTLLGETIGVWFGDMLYTLMFGGGLSAVGEKLKKQLLGIFNAGKAVAGWIGGGVTRFIKNVIITDPITIPEGGGVRMALTKGAKMLGIYDWLSGLGFAGGKDGQIDKFPNILNVVNPFKFVPLLVKSFFPPDEQGVSSAEPAAAGAPAAEEKKKPEMKELTGEDKKRALEKLEYVKKRHATIRAHGYDSDELKALEAERLEQIGKNTYPKGDASSITPKANNNIDSISSQASYDSNEGSTQFIPLPLVEGGGGTSGSTSSSSGGGGGGGSSEDASDPLLTLYMGK